MKKLLKLYALNSDMDYFEMIAQSFNVGQRQQGKNQFLAMPRKERIAFLRAATVGGWRSSLSDSTLGDMFDLLA